MVLLKEIPNNWKEERFDQVAKIANGQVDPRKSPYCNYIHIGPDNVERNTGRILNPEIAKDLSLISGKYEFDENSIVYSKIRPNLNKLCIPDFKGLCSADMYPVWPKESILKEYLYHYMQAPHFVSEAIKCSMRTGIPKINRQDLNRIKVRYPTSKGEQLDIVNSLNTYDTAIEKTEALIRAKQQQFRWLATKLINGSGHHKALVGDVVQEVSARNRNNAIERVLSVTNHSGFVLPEDQFERRVASASLSNYKIVKRGQYAYNPSRINVGSIARLDNWDDGVLSPMYVVFALNEKKADSDYFLHWLSSSEAKQRIRNSAQGSVRETVSFGDLGSIPISLPPLPEQQRIAHTLNTAQEEIRLLQQLAEKYRVQKRGLMQKLLTGEWRVDSDKEAAA